jgi:hypothetical protein
MILKLLILILSIVIFLIYINYQIEGFSCNKNYTNTNINKFSYENPIKSSLPYDIIIKDKNNKMYDLGNDELNLIFKEIFNINLSKVISLIEGINWSKWNNIDELNQTSRLYNYYLNIIQDFKKSLNNSSLIIDGIIYNIISKKLNRYKFSIDNPNIYLLDLNIVIYRPNRPLAKDIKIIAICNGVYTNFLLVKVIGVIPECNLKSEIPIKDDDNYSEFIPTEIINYDMNSFIYDTNDKLANSQAEYNLYNKLLKDLI